MTRVLLVTALLFINIICFAQRHTISGYISDKENGEKLIGANVYDANTYKGSVTNTYGFYSITLDSDSVLLTISYVGYASYQKTIHLSSDINLNIELNPTIEIDEVVVEGKTNIGSVESSQMSVISLPMKTIKNLPVLLGETDIIKTLQLFPGVQSGSEGMSGMYVRGGGPDQNLILLDGVPVYNVSHLFGFFSVFNSDAIQNATLIKGGFPARYGGRLSSVLDISMKEGNTKEFNGVASIGLISSKFAVEGPINDKVSFIISGRRTYIDILTAPFIKMQQRSGGYDKLRAGYFFYDLNAKINYKLNNKNRLYLSGYMGKDKFYMLEDATDYKNEMQLWWGNITTALRWNHVINNKLFANTTLTYSRYKLLTGYYDEYGSSSANEMEYTSGISDIGAKVDFDYFPMPNHSVKMGFSNTYHTFNPGVLNENISSGPEGNVFNQWGNTGIYSNELGSYIEDDIRIGSLLKLNLGIHWSGFQVENSFYNAFEPRISTRVLLGDDFSLKAAYANMNQYINLLASSNIGLPMDLWVPSTNLIKPQIANQIAFGSMYTYKKQFDISIEGFYKKMDNLLEYKEGATFLSIEDDWERKVTQGKGWSYGLEFLFMKKYGNTTGWVGYTWSKSDRQFNTTGEEISLGKKFPYKYDRKHDISIVVSHKLKENIDLGVTWVFSTGNPTTLGLEKYPSLEQLDNVSSGNYYNESPITYYEHRNNYRMPNYHRLDVGVNFHKQKKHGNRTWNISVYNVYNRKNPFMLTWEEDYSTGQNKLMKISIFQIIPSFSYRFEF